MKQQNQSSLLLLHHPVQRHQVLQVLVAAAQVREEQVTLDENESTETLEKESQMVKTEPARSS
jgi:hypothetical protein